MYNEGISLAGDMLDTGIGYGIIQKNGNSYSYGEEKLGVGRENAKTYLKDNPKMMKQIKKEIWQQVKASPPEKQ